MAAGNLWDWACEFWLILRSWGSVSGYIRKPGKWRGALGLGYYHRGYLAAVFLQPPPTCVWQVHARALPGMMVLVFGDREIVCNRNPSNF